MITIIKLAKPFFFISLILLVGYFIFANELPPKEDILPELLQEPKQVEVIKPAFTVERDEKTYTIEPLYSYDIYGLVVSYNHSDSWYDYYHKQWGDSLNKKDIALIWGNNARSGIYHSLKFWNGSWTAYWKSRRGVGRDLWSQFNNHEFSNNHLLAGDLEVQKKIMTSRKGDQIHMKGYLSNYSHSGFAAPRGTSISRTDTGNGACETIFVTEFDILKKSNLLWRYIGGLSKLMLCITLVILIAGFFIKPADSRNY